MKSKEENTEYNYVIHEKKVKEREGDAISFVSAPTPKSYLTVNSAAFFQKEGENDIKVRNKGLNE